MNLSEFFACPTYVLNMARSTDRLPICMNRIKEAGFTNVTRFADTVDAKNLEDLNNGWIKHGSPKFDKSDEEFCVSYKGKQGCMLSWLNLLKFAIDKELPYFIGFEDDVMFHPGWNNLVEPYLLNTPNDFDVLYLGGQIEAPIQYMANQIAPLPVFCTQALLFSLNGAKRIYDLLLQNPNGVRTIDCMLIDMQKEVFYRRKNMYFKWYVWNATMYPVDINKKMDPGWAKRNNGLVFQDDAFESEVRIWNK